MFKMILLVSALGLSVSCSNSSSGPVKCTGDCLTSSSDTCSTAGTCVCGAAADAVACSGATPTCVDGTCVATPSRFAFITNIGYTPGADHDTNPLNFNSAVQADKICQLVAAVPTSLVKPAYKKGTWMAYLAQTGSTAISRFQGHILPGDTRPIYSTDKITQVSGPIFSTSSSTPYGFNYSTHLNAINFVATSTTATNFAGTWTGVLSAADTQPATNATTCNNWTSGATTAFGTQGNIEKASWTGDNTWNFVNTPLACNNAYVLYCIEVDY